MGWTAPQRSLSIRAAMPIRIGVHVCRRVRSSSHFSAYMHTYNLVSIKNKVRSKKNKEKLEKKRNEGAPFPRSHQQRHTGSV